MLHRGRSSSAVPRVGVRVDYSRPAGHAQLAGIAQYASLHGPWMLQTHPRGGFAGLTPGRPFEGEGMIVHASEYDFQDYRQSPRPVVNLGGLVLETGLPSVLPDSLAIGQLAAEHLIDRGFRHLVYCGFRGHGYSELRFAGATETAARHGVGMEVYPLNEEPRPDRLGAAFYEIEQASMVAWLEGLPKPVGVICANDMRARQIAAACFQAGLGVPEQVAIVGVDDDEVLCETTVPPLSSIAIDFRRLGYEAAALLDRLMKGEPPPTQPRLLPPLGVIERQSTDLLAIDDPDLARALQFIRENAAEMITVENVLKVVPVSRRSLERRIRDTLGRSLQEEIRRIQVENAKRLLAQSDLTMPHVAVRAGFSSAERLSVVFKRQTGETPTAYRHRHRHADA